MNDYPLSVCHQIICFGLLQPHGWTDNAESEVAILILESTWLIADNVSAHAQTDNAEFIKSSCHSNLEMSPRQLLIHVWSQFVLKGLFEPISRFILDKPGHTIVRTMVNYNTIHKLPILPEII